jgi:hypothetical protein
MIHRRPHAQKQLSQSGAARSQPPAPRPKPISDAAAMPARSRRRCGLPPGRHPSDPDHYYPMMVGAVVRDDRLVAIHRTFLRADGTRKADLDPAKLTLGTCKGASVPLAPAGPILAIAEGIETALSFMQATGIPTWSACPQAASAV